MLNASMPQRTSPAMDMLNTVIITDDDAKKSIGDLLLVQGMLQRKLSMIAQAYDLLIEQLKARDQEIEKLKGELEKCSRLT